MGISFKVGTDDLRHSPSVEIIEQLLGKGKNVLIYDKNIELSKLMGANKSYIEEKLPHISSLITDNIDELIERSDVIVFPNRPNSMNNLSFPEDKIIIDFARVVELIKNKNYIGLNW